jgi:hypothetical protein
MSTIHTNISYQTALLKGNLPRLKETMLDGLAEKITKDEFQRIIDQQPALLEQTYESEHHVPHSLLQRVLDSFYTKTPHAAEIAKSLIWNPRMSLALDPAFTFAQALAQRKPDVAAEFVRACHAGRIDKTWLNKTFSNANGSYPPLLRALGYSSLEGNLVKNLLEAGATASASTLRGKPIQDLEEIASEFEKLKKIPKETIPFMRDIHAVLAYRYIDENNFEKLAGLVDKYGKNGFTPVRREGFLSCKVEDLEKAAAFLEKKTRKSKATVSSIEGIYSAIAGKYIDDEEIKKLINFLNHKVKPNRNVRVSDFLKSKSIETLETIRSAMEKSSKKTDALTSFTEKVYSTLAYKYAESGRLEDLETLVNSSGKSPSLPLQKEILPLLKKVPSAQKDTKHKLKKLLFVNAVKTLSSKSKAIADKSLMMALTLLNSKAISLGEKMWFIQWVASKGKRPSEPMLPIIEEESIDKNIEEKSELYQTQAVKIEFNSNDDIKSIIPLNKKSKKK